jgi:hypothetical protein
LWPRILDPFRCLVHWYLSPRTCTKQIPFPKRPTPDRTDDVHQHRRGLYKVNLGQISS